MYILVGILGGVIALSGFLVLLPVAGLHDIAFLLTPFIAMAVAPACFDGARNLGKSGPTS